MKKIIVLLAAMSLFAGSAFAGIAGTAHDLSSAVGSTTASTEICVFCHTPHGASAAGFAPLWNRGTVDAQQLYVGVDIQAAYNSATVNATDAPLCLSCHDGSSLGNALNNPPNTPTGFDASLLAEVTGETIIGTDLSNDHPIGFNFSAVNSLDGEIETQANVALTFYGSGTNMMWCSTCHDVHSNSIVPFLAATNAGSALCLECHIK